MPIDDADEPFEKADESLTLRLASSFKRRLINAARAQDPPLKLSPFILKTLHDAIEYGGAGCQEDDALRSAVASAGIPWETFRSDLLRQLSNPSPWLHRPGQEIVAEPESLGLHRSCVQRLLEGLAGGRVAKPVSILLAVPRAGILEPATPTIINHYLLRLAPILRQTLAEVDVILKVLFIDRERKVAARAQDEPLWAALLADESRPRLPPRPSLCRPDFTWAALIGDESRPRPRVEFSYLSLADAMGIPGQSFDRSLNLFCVYPEAVAFTVETSYGVPVRFAFSTIRGDISYWRQRFEELRQLCPADSSTSPAVANA
jgi:hypothetical protein